jgi:hypothetical protein
MVDDRLHLKEVIGASRKRHMPMAVKIVGENA